MSNSPFPLFNQLQTFLFRRSDLNSHAIEALSKAIFEVEKYYRDIRLGETPSRERETKIAECWREAAEPVRRVDASFSMICERKVYLWLNPSEYSRQDIKDYEMSLESIRRRLQELKEKK